MAFTESTVIDYTARTVYSIMEWTNPNYWVIWAGVSFIASMLSLAPWTLQKDHDFLDLMAHTIRRCLFWTGLSLVVGALFFFWCYDMSYRDRVPHHWGIFQTWLWESFKAYGWMPIGATLAGFGVRLVYFRYVHVWLSSLFRKWRNTQSDEVESDIRTERERFNAKDFMPAKFYDPKGESIFVGLDTEGKPLTIPIDTWRETNMQIIGPTRYGKGVAAGCIMDQVVRLGDALFYIDPKKDRWAPHLLLQACMETGRPFYYVALHDNSIGYWSPFEGGNRRDAYTRLTAIFEMQEGGDAGTDFYKAQEKKLFNRIIRIDQSFAISDIYHTIKTWNDRAKDQKEKALKIEAQLENWSQIGALNPPKGVQGFSIEKALLEGACVYVQGDLMDETVKKATKAFIMELIQESMRLAPTRKNHVTIVIDELRFLVSKIVADALATAVGSRVNIVTMYQSILDLRSPDDVNLDGESILQSVNVNSQVKLIYGGADFETAKWVAELSGTRNKSVTAMEKTNIRTAGAEEFERGRTLKTLAEALIPENVVLTLPPRVCVLFRPRELAAVSHSAFVPVRNEEALPRWLQARKDDEDRILEEQLAKSRPAAQLDDEDESIFTSDAAPRAVAAAPPPAPVPVPTSADPLPRFQIAELVAKGLDTLPEEEFNYCFGTTKRKQEVKTLIGEAAFKLVEKKWQEGKKAKARARSEAEAPQIPEHEQQFFEAGNAEVPD